MTSDGEGGAGFFRFLVEWLSLRFITDGSRSLVFPVAVPDPDGRPAMAMIHRPLFPGTEATEIAAEPTERVNVRYSAGALVLDRGDPRIIRYRSTTPILTPELTLEREGAVAEVVFPTGVDQRSDLGDPTRIDVAHFFCGCPSRQATGHFIHEP